MTVGDGFAAVAAGNKGVVDRPTGVALRRIGRGFGHVLLVTLVGIYGFSSGTEAKPTREDYAIIGEALHAADMDEWPRALTLMDAVEDPLAGRLFQWVTLLENKAGADFDTIATFIIDNPDWPRIDDLQRQAEARLTDSANKALTIELFRRHEPLTTRGRTRFAEALFAGGDRDEAVRQVRLAWVEGDFSTREEKAFLQRHQQHLTHGDHQARLEALLWDRQRRAAGRMLPRVSDSYQTLARARLALQAQAPGVDRAVNAVPTELADDPGLQYDRIRWRRLKGKHTGAKELLLNPAERLVRPERWWFERSFQIRRAIADRSFDEAYRLASVHGQLKGGDYAEAEWLSGWLALRFIDQPKVAFRRFVRLYDRVTAPVHQARAAYWAGRAAAQQGDDAGATAWYRRAALHRASYYGQLALTELSGETAAAIPSEPTEAESAAFEAQELAEVARMLIAAGDRTFLEDVLADLAAKAKTPAEIGLIADYAQAAGQPTLLATLGRRAAFYGKVHENAAFPIPTIDGLLEPDAAVEPSLLLSVARQESMFRSAAKSPAGAQGLLQLLPSTANIVARNIGVPYDRDRLTADPDYNAFLGGHYLESLIERFDGELALALAGYNAGPLRVQRWLELHGDPRNGDRHDLIDWIELIPFGETRNYVQRVLEGYGVYRRRLAAADIELIDYPGINLLHPPHVPSPRPADLTGDLVAQSEAAASLVHRPELKPLDLGDPATAAIERSFDGGRSQDVAAEEGGNLTRGADDEAPKL